MFKLKERAVSAPAVGGPYSGQVLRLTANGEDTCSAWMAVGPWFGRYCYVYTYANETFLCPGKDGRPVVSIVEPETHVFRWEAVLDD